MNEPSANAAEAVAHQDVEAQIRSEVARARRALSGGRFRQAIVSCDRAQARAVDAGIYRTLPEIDRLRDRARAGEQAEQRAGVVLHEAEQSAADGAIDQAIRSLDNLLAELAWVGLDDLGRAACDLRDRLWLGRPLPDQFADVWSCFEAQDFHMAQSLVDLLQQAHSGEPGVILWRSRVQRQWNHIQAQLTEASQKLAQGNLEEVTVILARLREDWPSNPDIRRLWLRAHLDHGLAQMGAGRLALQADSFESAIAAFESAQAALLRATETAPAHVDAGQARDEAAALAAVAAYAAQAQNDYQEQRWEAAQRALRAALDKHAEARGISGHDFGDVAAVLEQMLRRVDATVADLAQARGLLAKGRDLLAQNAPDRAEECFHQGLVLVDLNDQSLKQALHAGLQEAESVQAQIRELLTQANETESDVERLRLLQAVFTRWPGAPDMPGLLVQAFLRAAAGAAQAGDEPAAVDWCAQVLALPETGTTPEQRAQAAQLLNRIRAKGKVEHALAEVDCLAERLAAAPCPTAAAYRELVDALRRLSDDAGDYPEAQPAVEQRLRLAQDRLARLTRAEPLIARAEALRGRGEWSQAVSQLDEALATLDDLPAPDLHASRQAWQGVADAVNGTLQAAHETLARANALYTSLGEPAQGGQAQGTAPASCGGVSPLQAFLRLRPEIECLLAEAQTTLDQVPVGADPLPASWPTAQELVTELQARCRMLGQAGEAMAAGQPLRALELLAEVTDRYPDDQLLAAARKRLFEETQVQATAEARSLLDQAVGHIERGEWDLAGDKLSAAGQQPLAATEVAVDARRALERRLAAWKEINALHQQAEAELAGGNAAQAQVALEHLLQRAGDPDSGLSEDVRSAANVLLVQRETPLHDDESQRKGRQILEALASAAVQSRLVQKYLLAAAESWFGLATRCSYESYIAAQIGMGEYEHGYATAKRAMVQYPHHIPFAEQATAARNGIQACLRSFVQRRLEQARALYDQGALDDALAILDRVEPTETDFVSCVQANFPEIMRQDEALTNLRRAEADLRHEIRVLQVLSQQLAAILKDAQAVYMADQLEEASRKLKEARLIENAERARPVWQALQRLSAAIEEDRRNATLAQVRAALDRADLALQLARSAPEALQVVDDLAAVQEAVEGSGGPEAKALRQRFEATTAKAQKLFADLESVAHARQTAEAAGAQGHLQYQLVALQRARAVARGEELEQIMAEVERLQPLVEQQRQMQEAWDAALIALDKHDFASAQDRLALARQLGRTEEEVQPYRKAAQAGLLLSQARERLCSDPTGAHGLLRQVLETAGDHAPAQELRVEAESHLVQIERDAQQRAAEEAARREAEAQQQREEEVRRKRVSALLRSARSAFRLNRIADARRDLSEIFAGDPQQPEALDLWECLDRAEQASILVQRAKELRNGADYDAALELVKRALELQPELSEAQELPVQLMSEREAGIALARALELASAKRFMEARAELQRARDRNPRHPRLTQMQDQLQQIETDYWEATVRTAEEALARRAYREALSAYAQLSTHLHPADYGDRLGSRRQDVVDQWADWVAAQAEDALGREGVISKSFSALLADLQEVLAADPVPSGDRGRTLRELSHRVGESRLQRRLVEGYERLQVGDFASAEAIGRELEQITAQGDWPSLDFAVIRFNEEVKLASARLRAREPVEDAAAPVGNHKGLPLPTPMVKDVSQPSAERAQAVEAAYQQALAALEIYDLDAAQSALEAGRRIDDGDGRWAELAERLVQAQQIAFSVCAAMEDGWTHWHNRAFDEAQEAFGSVASLSEEAARWQRHAGYLQQGIDWALQLEEEPALAHLSRAEAELGQPQGMPLQPGEHLMALWGDRLLAERRQAVYYTRCLCNEVSTMLAERKRKDELKARNDVAGASQVLRSLIQRQESFPELVKAQAEPPDDLEL